MMLAIDAGNSRVKWGLREAGAWRAQGAVELAGLPTLAALLPARVPRAVVANVAGAQLAAQLAELLAGRAGTTEWLRPQAERCGVINGYRDPAQLGVDRWAALIGARGLVGGACVVVMAGTATTVDVLDAAGRFRGGLIVPGLALMRESLARNTAGLGHPEGRFAALPACTADAIVSGCLNAQLGAIERMHRQLPAAPAAPVVLGGGAAGPIAEQLRLPLVRVEHLVLEGLARIGGD